MLADQTPSEGPAVLRAEPMATAAGTATAKWTLRCKLKNSKKKARDGQLSFDGVGAATQLRFDWAPAGGAARPQFRLPLASVTDQMVSKGDDKAMMKVVTADPSQICVVQFHSKQDQQAMLTRLLELRGALAAPTVLPPVVLSGADRGKYLAKDKQLRAQYQELVAEGALRDEDFWKDEQLQERLVLERAESGAGASALAARAPQRVGPSIATATGGTDAGAGATDAGAGTAQQEDKPALVDKEMSEHIFVTQPSVYADYKASVLTGQVAEADFWADYLQAKQSSEAAAASAGPTASSGSAEGDSAEGDGTGAHLLGILRGAATKERALHERRIAAGVQPSASSRQAADESRPAAIGLQASVSERHAASAAEAAAAAAAADGDGSVFQAPAAAVTARVATAGATLGSAAAVTAAAAAGGGGAEDSLEWSEEGPKTQTDFGSMISAESRRGSERRQKRQRPSTDASVGIGSGEEVDDDDDEADREEADYDLTNENEGAEEGDDDDEGDEDSDDEWCADISNWEPCSVVAFRNKRRRLVAQSRAAAAIDARGDANYRDSSSLLSFTLGGGGPYGISAAGAEATAAALAAAAPATPAADRCVAALTSTAWQLWSSQALHCDSRCCGGVVRYTSELKACFARSLQYLRHFWLAMRRGDRAKARRMHAALQQLYDTIETQNMQLGAAHRASLAPMSHHLQQEMLRTALTMLPAAPTGGNDG